MAWAKQQPNDGETITHCGHLDAQRHHFFMTPDGQPMKFSRPDGTVGESRWIVLCHDCFDRHADNPLACICGDSVWDGNDPFIRENVA